MQIKICKFPNIARPYGCYITCACSKKQVSYVSFNPIKSKKLCSCKKVVYIPKFILNYIERMKE